mmetsp:Transcript_54344/g.61750  ORF Transcript_54344/g.61750 Transcript_54344/m.61750 type:complete len:211 (+) Transcript_54344:66-698(+)
MHDRKAVQTTPHSSPPCSSAFSELETSLPLYIACQLDRAETKSNSSTSYHIISYHYCHTIMVQMKIAGIAAMGEAEEIVSFNGSNGIGVGEGGDDEYEQHADARTPLLMDVNTTMTSTESPNINDGEDDEEEDIEIKSYGSISIISPINDDSTTPSSSPRRSKIRRSRKNSHDSKSISSKKSKSKTIIYLQKKEEEIDFVLSQPTVDLWK